MKSNLSQLLTFSHPRTLFELLGRYRVVVPAIQRHYVQGANTPKAKEVRLGFLSDLFTHFKEHPDCPFKLDYIFGPIRTDGDDAFVPVDGQQRLTTVWLLARYAVEKVPQTGRIGLLYLLARFTYEGRLFAQRFCDAITRADSPRWWDENQQSIQKPSAILRQKGVLNPGWMSDATVAAMSCMLDAIHEKWSPDIDAEKFLVFLWTQVQFELCHDQFSDDIYMKMNARGLDLTQWENAKGRFSEWFDNPDNEWNAIIEQYSDQFFSLFKDSVKAEIALPDNPFFALLGRICAYEATRSDSAANQMESHPALLSLANSQLPGVLPYVPFSDFEKALPSRKKRKETLKGFLRLLSIFISVGKETETPKWWGKSLCDRFFYPQTDADRDLSLLFFEFAKAFPTEDIDAHILSGAARLFGNLLENTSRDTKSPWQRIERIASRFLHAGTPNPYLGTIEVDQSWNKEPLAYLEEVAKTIIYRNGRQDDIDNLQAIEEVLRGRCRLAVLNIREKQIAEGEICRKRLDNLSAFCSEWTDGDEHSRRQKLIQIIKAMPFELRAQFKYSVEGNALLDYFCTENDQDLQVSLFPCCNENRPIVLNLKLLPWQRDWRLVLCHLIENEDDFQFNDHHEQYVGGIVRRTYGGCYLIRANHSTITGSFPLSDWRIELHLRSSSDCRKVLTQIVPSFTSARTNDANTRSAWINQNRLILYLADKGLYVRKRDQKEVEREWMLKEQEDLVAFLNRVKHDVQELYQRTDG